MESINKAEKLWMEKYRPRTIEDVIMPEDTKNIFRGFVKNNEMPNLILCSRKGGTGKTSTAKSLCNDLGYDSLVINASLEGNIDLLRNKLTSFVTSVSLTGNKKCVILDEADYLNCLDENETIVLGNGLLARLGDLKQGMNYYVMSYDMKNRHFHPQEATVIKKTEQIVYEILMNDNYVAGRTVSLRCTADHPIIVIKDDVISTRTIEQGLDGYEIVSMMSKSASITSHTLLNNGSTHSDYYESPTPSTLSVISIEKIGVRRVVDLCVDEYHTFVTGSGVVVHNCNSTQPALRNFMESYSKNCRFILTCNFVNRLLDPILSRCTVVDFDSKITKETRKELMTQALKRLVFILKNENIEFDPKSVTTLLVNHFPDMRRCINELQRYSSTGRIDAGILINTEHDNFSKLVTHLREKKFNDMRDWVSANSDISDEKLFGWFYDNASTFMEPSSIPQLVLTTADYQYKSAFVADKQINIAAYLTELMSSCEFIH